MEAHEVVARLGLCRRVAVIGGPRCGKSEMARKIAGLIGAPHRPTDEVRDLGWSEASDAVADWMREKGPQVVEGVAAVRALRKVLDSKQRPSFVVVMLRTPKVERTPEQENMAKGHETIFRGIAAELRRRGVLVIDADATSARSRATLPSGGTV